MLKPVTWLRLPPRPEGLLAGNVYFQQIPNLLAIEPSQTEQSQTDVLPPAKAQDISTPIPWGNPVDA
jgi:hypothetical protein